MFLLVGKAVKLKRMKLAIVVISICLLVYQPCEAQEYPSQEEHDWVSSHFFSILEAFLPIEESGPLSYRSYRDLYTDVLEYSFVFSEDWKERRVNVVVRIADSVSLYDQMMALHRSNPSESIESIKVKLRVKEWHSDNKSCPAVKSSYDEFDRFRLRMLSAKDRAEKAKGIATITLHPTVHTFKAYISGGDMELVLTEQAHPFVLWAKNTRRALEKCAASEARVK